MSGSPSAKPHERREIYFSGRVQGVGFRYTARNIALRYAVTGFVCNLYDGRVQLVVEGEPQEIDGVVAELRTEMGRFIRGEESSILPATGEFNNFAIRP